jgi:FkbM family methyltransferase
MRDVKHLMFNDSKMFCRMRCMIRLYNIYQYYRAFLPVGEWGQPKNTYSILNKIDRYSRFRKGLCFVQIGANDGTDDPVYEFVRRYDWRGILVEPQKDVFENRLKKRYESTPAIILENSAIADKAETRKLHKISFSSARWATGLTSFIRSSIEKQIDSGRVARKAKEEDVRLPEKLSDYITTEHVQCMTFDDLIRKHEIQKLDLVVIDTEGYDYEIIKLIDFDLIRPELIMFEYKHLSSGDYKECSCYLKNSGYELYCDSGDMLAVHKSINSELKFV